MQYPGLILLLILSAILGFDAMASETEYDVVIVGSGLSGLTAAYRLKQADPELKVKILEARSRYGGRVFSPEFQANEGRKDNFNLGAEWIGERQSDIVELLKELGLEYYESVENGKSMRQDRYGGPFREFEWLNQEKDPDDQETIFRLAQQFDADIHSIDLANLPAEELEKFEAMSLDDYLIEKRWPKWCREALSGYVEEDVDSDSKHLSFAFFVIYFQRAETFNSFFDDIKAGFVSHRVSGGSQRIADELVKRLGDGVIELNSPVTSIVTEMEGNDQYATVTYGGGTEVYADRVILAIPPITVSKIAFDPPLSAARMKMYSNFRPFNYRTVEVKAIITYETAFWRSRGLSGFAEAQGSYDRNLRMELPFVFAADTTSANGSPALVVFASVESKDEAKQKAGILSILSKAFGPEAMDYIEYQQKVWSTEPYVQGCVATFEPGKFDYRLHEELIRKPEGLIHFAGTETAEKNPLYMSGAINAGNRVANEILSLL